MLQEPYSVTNWMSMASVKIGVELTEQSGHRHSECAPIILLRRHRSGFGVDYQTRLTQPVATLDGATHSLLTVHSEDSTLDEQAHLPVHGGLRDIRHPSEQLGSSERSSTRHGMHDTQSHWMEEEFDSVHVNIVSHLTLFSHLRLMWYHSQH